MSAVNNNQSRMGEILLRLDAAEQQNTRLEAKLDNVNRNLVTAATIGGAAAGVVGGVALVAMGGFVLAGAAVVKATAICAAGVVGGGLTGSGVGHIAGEILVRAKLGEGKK